MTRSPSRIGRRALLLLAGAGVVLAVPWAMRRPIATAVIDRKLAAAHVPARYRIETLGLGRQRLVDVAIGNPARPDLVADWIELSTHLGLDGARVTGVRAGRLRLRARLVDGHLSLGTLDRLLPASTGAGPFHLPPIDLAAERVDIDLATPAGAVTLALRGAGRLDDGFRGQVQARAPRLAARGCTLEGLEGALAIATAGGAPMLSGPVSARALACATVRASAPALRIAASLSPDLTRWRGQAAVRSGQTVAATVGATALAARLSFAGTATATDGTAEVQASRVTGPRSLAAQAVGAQGRFRIGQTSGFSGRVSASRLAIPRAASASAADLATATAATPLAPLTRQAARAVAALGGVDLTAALTANGTALTVTDLVARAESGASARLGGPGLAIDGGQIRFAGNLALAGGGLPTLSARLRRRPDGAITGQATVAPYAAPGARLALAPVRFTVTPAGAVALTTSATLSGPLSGGRVEDLSLPLVLRWTGQSLLLGPGCAPVAFRSLALSTLRLNATRADLCPVGPALVRTGRGGVRAEATIGPIRLAGRLGTSPLTASTGGARLSLAGRSVTARDVAVALGAPEAPTRLSLATLSGTAMPGGIGGRFAGGNGRIGAVPLLLDDAGGGWQFRNGTLDVTGALTVADAGAPARFRPLHAEQVALRLADGTITAGGRLVTPTDRVPIANVTLSHQLASGTGEARLAVVPLAFTERFQPDALTPLTFGVIADVRGTVTGDARIGWSPAGTTSTGAFHTEALDLAAAFGPVTGLAGTIRFTDLLSLQSAPDQVVTIASINPGVAVTDGRVTFRTLPGARVQVASGHWPFAGGALDLQPTLLDFAAAADRRLTFTLTGIDAARFLQQFDFKNLSASGTFDGSLPMIFDPDGGRIEGGRLRVRSGGNIAYLGDLTQKDLGLWGNLAFQALRSIDYRDLVVTLNGPLAGEMITDVRFAGISQGKGARSNFLIRRLQRLPFVFNIRIRAPFRGLVDSAQSFYDPTRLIQRNLPALMSQQAAPVQPADSDPHP